MLNTQHIIESSAFCSNQSRRALPPVHQLGQGCLQRSMPPALPCCAVCPGAERSRQRMVLELHQTGMQLGPMFCMGLSP